VSSLVDHVIVKGLGNVFLKHLCKTWPYALSIQSQNFYFKAASKHHLWDG